MPKTKKLNPLFLEIINLQFVKIFGYGLRLLPDVGNVLENNNIKANIKIQNHLKWLLKKRNLSPKHASMVKQVIERLQQFIPEYLKDNTPEYLHSIAQVWCRIRDAIEESIGGGGIDKVFSFQDISKFFEEVQPTFISTDTDEIGIIFKPAPPKDPSETPELVGFLRAEFIQFMIDEYKSGIFAHCSLKGSKQVVIDDNGREHFLGYERCEQIIIAANGRKYCCPYHRKKASKLKIEKNKNKLKRNRIRDRLRKQFERNPFEKDREKYIKNHWPKDEIDLYHEPHSANK